MLKIKELKETQGNNAKKDFVRLHKDDKEFIMCLRFLLDDFRLTHISTAKLNKEILMPCDRVFYDICDLLLYAQKGTGRDQEVVNIQNYIKNLNTKDEQEIVYGLITKTYNANFGVSLFNASIPENPIIESPYMGCIPFDEKKVLNLIAKSDYVISQIKNDGMFVNLICTSETVDFTARSGLPLYINGNLPKRMEWLRTKTDADFVITGELMLKGYDRMTANGILRGLISSNGKILNGDIKEASNFLKKYGNTIEYYEQLIYVVAWDLLPYEDFKKAEYNLPYKDRLKNMEQFFNGNFQDVVKITEYRIVNTYSEIMLHFQEMLARGEEGTVLKSPDGIWKDGKPNTQIKMKLEICLDLQIVGFNSGKMNTKYEHTLGSLQVQSADGIVKTDMSGISDDMRDEIWNNKDVYLNKIVEIKCNGISSNRDGGISLLYPAFLSVREDKKVADSYEQILSIQNMKLNLTKEV